MSEVTLAGAVIAVTQMLKNLFPAISGWITIVVAAVLGLLAGFTGVEGFTPVTGLFAGLMAAGTVYAIRQVLPPTTE